MFASEEYLQSRVLYASPTELVVLLYERAVEVMGLAETATTGGDARARAGHISKALAIIQELQMSLRETAGSTLAENLRGLYLFAQERLLFANSCKEEVIALQQVRLLLLSLLEAWRQVASGAAESGKRGADSRFSFLGWGGGNEAGGSGFSAEA